MSRGNPVLRIRLAPEDRIRWQAGADRAGVSLSEWVRAVIERSLKRRRGAGVCPSERRTL